MSTIKVSNLQNASAASAAIVLASDSTATLNGLSYPTEGSLSGRNRIINGDMRIDQRNAGAAVTTHGAYTIDRFAQSQNGGGTVSWARSTVCPAGFTNSLGATVTTADSSIAAGDYYRLYQHIEGFNAADLNFGSASAKTITLSFWVRSSITGTYCIGLQNGSYNRSYAAEYTISAANAWEYKTITLTGDISGTWATDNTAGVTVFWDLGSGSAYNQTANSWAATNTWKTSSQTSWIATNGATFYITGVQLEAGSVATPFERRSYGQELSLCQRYYRRFLALPGYQNQDVWQSGYGSTNALKIFDGQFSTMRSGPNVSLLNNSNIQYYSYAGAWTNSTLAVQTIGAWPNLQIYLYATADGDGRGKLLRVNNASGPEVIVVCDIEL